MILWHFHSRNGLFPIVYTMELNQLTLEPRNWPTEIVSLIHVLYFCTINFRNEDARKYPIMFSVNYNNFSRHMDGQKFGQRRKKPIWKIEHEIFSRNYSNFFKASYSIGNCKISFRYFYHLWSYLSFFDRTSPTLSAENRLIVKKKGHALN